MSGRSEKEDLGSLNGAVVVLTVPELHLFFNFVENSVGNCAGLFKCWFPHLL